MLKSLNIFKILPNPNSKEKDTPRGSKILENKKMLFANKFLERINLFDILPFAKEGDVLIVKRVRAEDFPAKRILKLTNGGGC